MDEMISRKNRKDYDEQLWGSMYKGDGITTCKWCGNTGLMKAHGHFEYETECWFCEYGKKLMCKRQEKDNTDMQVEK